MLVRRTLDRYTRYAQTLIVITVSDLDQVLTCGNVKVNKTKFVALSNICILYLYLYFNISNSTDYTRNKLISSWILS